MLLRSAEGRFGDQAGEGGDDYRSASARSVASRRSRARRVSIARRCGSYIDRGLEPPAYGPRKPRVTHAGRRSTGYLRERVTAYPELSGARLLRELRERGYRGRLHGGDGLSARCSAADGTGVRGALRDGARRAGARWTSPTSRWCSPTSPTTPRIVWLFSMVLGYSRLIWARFVVHQDLPTVLRCHVAAFEALGGAPRELLYDRMKTAVTGDGRRGRASSITGR